MNEVQTAQHPLARRPVAPGASQGTVIEQSRAIAQVQGALVVARQFPRDTIRAMAAVREACGSSALAEIAFFKFPRGGQNIVGPSIRLATELARCWGNVDYGIAELARDDGKGESEMLAVAWDLETNNRVYNSFIVPHKRDKKGGPEALTDMRDIYENNANNAARRLRECIFRVLPAMVVEEGKTLCRATLEHGDGEPVVQRIEKLLEAFAAIGITRRQIEKRVGVAADKLSPVDIANMRIVYQSLRRGEIEKDQEFPPDHAAEITTALKASKHASAAAAAADAHDAGASKFAATSEKPPEPKAVTPSAQAPAATALQDRSLDFEAQIADAKDATEVKGIEAQILADENMFPLDRETLLGKARTKIAALSIARADG